MKPVDYDAVAPAYDKRYERNDYSGIAAALSSFVSAATRQSVLEVGCGTGHWLADIASSVGLLAGIDRSWEMLSRARIVAPRALLVRATAEQLPCDSDSVDRIFCVNALHHFEDKTAFLKECRRVLRAGGAFLTIGLDPHPGLDQWWVYDYFPTALELDRRRYPSTEWLRGMLQELGFTSVSTTVVHHIPAERPFDIARAQGLLDRRSTSQLMVISDADYEAGQRRILEEHPTLRADLRLYGTFAALNK